MSLIFLKKLGIQTFSKDGSDLWTIFGSNTWLSCASCASCSNQA